ncbi:CidA/LrgA family protein [Brachybacterium sp. FME24]|uniref:CidA/LrgA family protein n=1 Tax=Brachybacterium sp. FME24 TaxID=2742605 RepID=UPI0018676BCF|nr:CidA/LrgA family protein [Brachybacterium sp. FME24]
MSRAAALPPVLLGLVVLLLVQMVGLAVSALLNLPVPGVVLGLVLLLLLGLLRPTRGVLRVAEPAATPLLQHLQLLFVPPGVGIMLELHALAQNALPIALAVGGSFVLTLLIAGWLLQALLRRQERRGASSAGDPTDGPGPAAGPDAEPGTVTS